MINYRYLHLLFTKNYHILQIYATCEANVSHMLSNFKTPLVRIKSF